MTNSPLNADTKQLEQMLRDHVLKDRADAAILAHSIAGCLWNMVCTAVDQYHASHHVSE
jgi:hypothetical protein